MGIKDWLMGKPNIKKSYTVMVVCMNCNHKITVRIGNGWSVAGWAKTAKCKVCKTRGNFEKSY
jgi:hypothetical protein